MLGSFCCSDFKNNVVFDLNSPLNRDDGFVALVKLRKRFLEHGIELNTEDLNSSNNVDFELHLDVQPSNNPALPLYLLMLETPQVLSRNGLAREWARYRKIFTWRDDLVDGERFIKINFPNPIKIHPVDGFSTRDRFCCLIAGNRAIQSRDKKVLYTERVSVIRWFEQNALEDFDLYGIGWNMPPVHPGLRGRIQRRIWGGLSRFFHATPFPSYRGRVEHKRDVLTKTRFAICYENVRDLPGYISEKIFDCFFSGCVPVYWGASNVTDYIPKDCFIDRRDFVGMESVYRALKTMSESEYRGFQERIAAFLQSEAAYPFSSECFAKTIADTVVQDLVRQS